MKRINNSHLCFSFRTFILSVLVLSIPCLILAQSSDGIEFDTGVQSPTAASLGKFGDVPVSLYTGQPQISIPLHELSAGNLKIPLALRYNNSGLKVEEIPAWVGMGWALEAGGVITRTVQGRPDEETNYGWFDTSVDLINQPLPQISYDYYSLVNNGYADPKPDLFFFNFAGYSGKFFYDENGQIRLSSVSPIDINWTIGSNVWTVRTPDGTTYVFEEYEKNMTQTLAEDVGSGNVSVGTEAPEYVSSWYLKEIRPYGTTGKITLTYDVQTFGGTIERRPYEEQIRNNNTVTSHVRITQHEVSQRKVWLKQIDSPTESVTFYRSGRTDYSDEVKLDSIKVYRHNSHLKSFAFKYGYFPPEPQYGNTRLRLDEIVPKDKYHKTLPSWKLQYLSGYMPAITSHASDLWGYYNGNHSNDLSSTLLAEYFQPNNTGGGGVTIPGDDRSPNSSFADNGALKEITYPTGGRSVFEYEGHSYSISGTNAPEPEWVQRMFIDELRGTSGPLTYTSNSFTVDGSGQITISTTVTETGPNTEPPQGEEQELSPFSIIEVQTLSGTEVATLTLGDGSIQVDSGTYQLYFERANTDIELSASLSWWEIEDPGSSNYVVHKPVGGIRIKKITHKDGTSNPDIIKNYKYHKIGTQDVSSGVLVTSPITHENFNFNGSDLKIRSSGSLMPLGSTNGAHLGYSDVIEEVYEGTDTLRTLHKFTSAFNFPDQLGTGLAQSPATSYDYGRGKLITKEWFDTNNNSVQKVENSYEHGGGPANIYYSTPALHVRRLGTKPADYTASNGPQFELVAYGVYNYLSVWSRQTQSIRYVIDPVSGVAMADTTQFFYDDLNHLQMTSKNEISSDGRVKRTNYEYAHENHQPGMVTSNMLNQIYSVTVLDETDPFNVEVLSKEWRLWDNSDGSWRIRSKWVWDGNGDPNNAIFE